MNNSLPTIDTSIRSKGLKRQMDTLDVSHKLSPKRDYTHRVALCCQELIDNSGHINKRLMASKREIKAAAEKYNVNADRIEKIVNCEKGGRR